MSNRQFGYAKHLGDAQGYQRGVQQTLSGQNGTEMENIASGAALLATGLGGGIVAVGAAVLPVLLPVALIGGGLLAGGALLKSFLDD